LKSDNQYQIEHIYNYLSGFYLQLNKLDSAILFSQRAIKAGKKSHSKEAVNTAYGRLNEIYRKRKQVDSAYFYLSAFKSLSDSIFNEEKTTRFEDLRIQLETLDKEREIVLVKKEAELQKANNTIFSVLLIGLCLVFAFVFLSAFFFFKNRQKQHKLKTLALEDEIMKGSEELRNQALKMIHLSNGLKEIEETLKKVRASTPSADVNHLLKAININRTMEKEWDTFDEYFGNIHNGFYEKLHNQFPEITISEKRLAGLVRMNLTNPEIARILNIEDSSVKTAKNRLKKRLQLSEETSLYSFLLQSINDGQIIH
jgi:DNA-binding NarL/FixJ family response regulator